MKAQVTCPKCGAHFEMVYWTREERVGAERKHHRHAGETGIACDPQIRPGDLLLCVMCTTPIFATSDGRFELVDLDQVHPITRANILRAQEHVREAKRAAEATLRIVH